MKISKENLQILKSKGYDSLEEYLQDLADENGQDIENVYMAFELLGEYEMFDGLVTSLEVF